MSPRRYVTKAGYVRVGQEFEHRLVAEHTLGRALRDDEIVHHTNGIRSDNRPENLEVLTYAEHGRRHALERYRAGLTVSCIHAPSFPKGSRLLQPNCNRRVG